VLKNDKSTNATPHPIPDLIITGVNWQRTTIAQTYVTNVYPPSSPPPIPAIEFFLHVTNISQVLYEGAPVIACERTQNDTGIDYYPYVTSGNPKKFNVAFGDTIILSVVVPVNPSSFTGLYRFLLVTQHDMPQSVRTFDAIHFAPEERTDNNVFDYVLE
jgi:hypothetical protein